MNSYPLNDEPSLEPGSPKRGGEPWGRIPNWFGRNLKLVLVGSVIAIAVLVTVAVCESVDQRRRQAEISSRSSGIAATTIATSLPGSGSRGTSTQAPLALFTPEVKNGTEGPLTLTSAAIQNGSLVVHLDAEYEGIEPFGDEFLVIEQGEIPGRMEIYPDDDVEVTFDGVDRIVGTVVLSRVNTSRRVSIETRMGEGALVLPDGLQFTFSSDDLVTGPDEITLVLTPVTPTSASIGLVTISRDVTTFPARAYSTVYEATGQARKPSMTFPIEAKELLEDPNSVLRVSQVRQVVRFEIPLSLCGQRMDCDAGP